MGNHHGDKWRRALPWVPLGKRIAFQPDLDTSAALLAFGRSPLIPGQLLGHPGPPLTSLQIKALLEELYRLEARPAMQTSAKVQEIDISETDDVTHVYVKVEEPSGLAPRFEGPYEIVSRPSRSQVQVRVGSFANGLPRLLTYHWSACKPAHMREGASEGTRPKLGRPSRPQSPPAQLDKSGEVPHPPPKLRPVASPTNTLLSKQNNRQANGAVFPSPSSQPVESVGAKIQTSLNERPQRSTRNPNPRYVNAIAA